MNTRAIRALVIKDLRVISRSRTIMMTLILVPFIMMILMPTAFTLGIRFATFQASDLEDLQQLFEAMPPGLIEKFSELSDDQLFLTLTVVYMFAPLYLIVPLMVSSVIAADSIVGEKERKTLEALLHSPLTDAEIFLAKVLSAWIPAVTVSIVAFIIYGVIANVLGYPVMGRVFFPNLMWIVLVFWVAPAASGLGLGTMVLVSTKVKTFQDAYQLGGMVVIPVVALVFGQLGGVIYLSVGFVFLMGLFLWLLNGVLLWFGIRLFERDSLQAQI